MKNPVLTFRGTLGGTEEFDRIISTEVYPAIVKAYATFRYEEKSELMAAATVHLIECLSDLCHELEEVYTRRDLNRTLVDDILRYLRERHKLHAKMTIIKSMIRSERRNK